MIYNLVSHTDAGLTTPCTPFSFEGKKVYAEYVATNLCETLDANRNIIGLSGNQVGLTVRAFALICDPIVAFNPALIDQSEEEIALEETSPTYPGLIIKVKRPKSIRLRYQGFTGETFTNKYTGQTARQILHQIDYLDGVRFYNRASKYHRDKAMKKWRG